MNNPCKLSALETDLGQHLQIKQAKQKKKTSTNFPVKHIPKANGLLSTVRGIIQLKEVSTPEP